MTELYVKKVVSLDGDVLFIVYEEGQLAKPIAVMRQINFARFLEHCQTEYNKPVSR